MMEKVLITGGGGFIGYHLAAYLHHKGCYVVIVDNFSRGVLDNELTVLSKEPNVELHDIDLLDLSLYEKIGTDFDIVYHFAAIIGVKHVLSSPYKVLTENVNLLDNVIKFCRSQKKIKRLLFTSTSEVYAGTLLNHGLVFPTPESTTLDVGDLNNPRTTYMLSKIYGEAMCLFSGLPVTIIRPHNFYGPRMGLSHVVPELLQKVYKNTASELDLFSPNHTRSFCYIDDAVESIWGLSISENSIGRTINVGNPGEEISMKNLAEMIISLVGKDIKIKELPPTTGSPSRRCPDIDLMNNTLGERKLTPLSSGLGETWRWYKENIFDVKGASAI